MKLFSTNGYDAVSTRMIAWAVAKYNSGYGTFDMKSYSPEIVSKVLGEMQDKGFEVYKKYYIADSFFVLTFGAVQIALLNVVYKWTDKKFRYILWSIWTIEMGPGAGENGGQVVMMG